MRTILRWAVPLAAILGFSGASLRAEATDKPTAKESKEKTGQSDTQKGPKKPRITISKETTHIVEPLRPDGYVDYIRALNQLGSKGVTPRNNAAVPLWQAMGPKEISEEVREKFFKMLGIPPLPEKGDYCIPLGKFVEQLQEQQPQDKPAGHLEEETVYDQQDQAMKRPWSKKEFPILASWLEANEKPLALIVEATRRPRRYMPLVAGGEPEMVISVLLPGIQKARNAARLLMCRAMFRLEGGNTDKAWADVLACHRLARLEGQGSTLIDALVSIAIEGVACQGDLALAHYGNLTAAEARKLQADLRGLPPTPKMADKVDTAERYMYLDAVAFIAREGPSAMGTLGGGRGKSNQVVEAITNAFAQTLIDWDVPLRMGNSWYDRLVEAIGKTGRAEREEAMAELDEDMQKFFEEVKDFKATSLSLFAGKSPRGVLSKQMGGILISLFLPATWACSRAEDRGRMHLELSHVALALAAYHADHGSYPRDLAKLAPKYIPKVPGDRFSGKPLRYKRKGKGYLLYSVGINGVDDGGRGYDQTEDEDWDDWDDLTVRTPAEKKKVKR